jgi:hypothetical protein
MATTVAQPGTALRRIAKQFASEAGLPVDQYLERLRRLNPEYSRAAGSNELRLGRGVGRNQQKPESDMGIPEGDTGEAPQPNTPEFEVANILNSPLYSQNLKDYYLTQYLPGLTQTTFDINQARNVFQANEAQRARQRGEAIKRVAGSYAARGMRSPAAINEDRSAIQEQFANLSREEQNQIQALINQRDVMYGAGAKDGETFMRDPNLFGSIGAGARRASLQELQQLPEMYNLLGLGASRAPLVPKPAPATPAAPATPSPASSPRPTGERLGNIPGPNRAGTEKGQTYTGSKGNTWRWSGSKWNKIGSK